MKRTLTLTLVCILLFTVQARAEITPQLLTEWSRQPNNVKWNVYHQNTNIQVVDNLSWQSPDLYETYAYTTMDVDNGIVTSADIVIKRGNESALTHEIGHVLSNYNGIPYYWCYTPQFQAIWQTEKYNNVLLVGQGEADIREYFACAYDLYIRYGPMLRRTCPLTYSYINSIVCTY